MRLYGGELLPEDRYDDWAIHQREELKALQLALLLVLGGLRKDRGETDAAVNALRQVVGIDPAHEEAQARLMLLLAETGHRHLALRHYQELCEALRRELDAEPDRQTQSLHREIIEGRFSSATAAPRSI